MDSCKFIVISHPFYSPTNWTKIILAYWNKFTQNFENFDIDTETIALKFSLKQWLRTKNDYTYLHIINNIHKNKCM